MGDVRGKTVLDLGCGSGPIALAAALKGAREVFAVDVMPEACEAVERNAVINGVAEKVTSLYGNLFEPLNGKRFDVIIDDVSGMAEEVSRISPWYPKSIPTGGEDGTGPTINMLENVSNHLNKNGFLIFPTISLTRIEKIISTAQKIFGEKLYKVTTKHVPFCEELLNNIDLLNRLKEDGLISFIQQRSRYLWVLSIYRGEL